MMAYAIIFSGSYSNKLEQEQVRAVSKCNQWMC